MGEIFKQGGLTNQGTMDPATGQTNFAQAPDGMKVAAKPMGIGTPPVLNPQTVQPSFIQAAQMGAQPGGVNALSPGLSKAGKLATLLTSGLQGALAGRAAQEQATVQSGGRRSGGAGMAMEAGYNLPAQRQATQQGLAQERAQTGLTGAQTELTQSQSELVDTPYGKLPPALAKVIFGSSIAAQAKLGSAQIGAEAKENVAQTNKRFMSVPGVGVLDTQDQSGKPTLIPGSAQGITLNQDHLNDYGLPKEFLGKQMSLQQLAGLERAQNQQTTTVQGAAGPALVNKRTAQTTPLGLGSPGAASRLAGPIEVADPDNPGNTKIVSGGAAIAQGAPGRSSASVSVPRQAAAAEVPTKIGDQKVAFTTMIQHADLLRRAAKALNNGDMQTVSGLENAFKNEFGYSGPITSAAIADAYKGEVSNVINKGHITDTGNEKIAHTLDPTKQNYQTIDSVLGAYQSLAQSKMNMLNKQTQSAITQSQPKKTGGQSPATGTRSATDPLGIR
jgi:hypothetical protein